MKRKKLEKELKKVLALNKEISSLAREQLEYTYFHGKPSREITNKLAPYTKTWEFMMNYEALLYEVLK